MLESRWSAVGYEEAENKMTHGSSIGSVVKRQTPQCMPMARFAFCNPRSSRPVSLARGPM
jgi:hypothetical protein